MQEDERLMENIDGIILVFAINDYDSFYFVKRKFESLKKSHFQCILVGNKSDLNSERENSGVTFETANNQAKSWKINYIETSINPVIYL